MKLRSLRTLFILLLLSAAVFVYVSSASLPARVGSHFALGGGADGFMPRGEYLVLMLGTVVGVPLFMVLLMSAVRLVPPRFINLPHRDYWLAPERISETLAYLSRQGMVFGLLICGLLCLMHWLVVLANRQQPPHLSESIFMAGLAIFLAATVVWLALFFVHFRRRA